MDAPSGNTVTISDAGPSKKRLTITIPAETVAARLRDSFDTLLAEATLPGFRRGRAPRPLLEKRFGSSIRSEAKNQLIASAYAEAVQQHELKILGDPTSESLSGIELEDGKALTFDLDVEVLPEFELPSLEGIAVRKPIVGVTDEMVGKEIEKLCLNEGALESRDVPEPGDYLTGHGIMTGPDGTEFYNIRGAVVQIPQAGSKGMILGIMVEDFAKQLGLPRPGETATIRAKGPENHEVERIRGADLTITFRVDRADRIIPASIGDLVAKLGFADEASIRSAMRERLEHRAAVEVQSAMRQQIANHLVSSVKIDLPERLTAQQAARNLDRKRMELMYRGFEPHTIEEHVAELRNASASQASTDLKLFFILNKAAESLKVRVEEGEINGQIARMAAERGVRPDKLRQELVQKNQVGVLFQQIRDHKTMDQLLSKATVTEVPLEEFNAQAEAQKKPRG